MIYQPKIYDYDKDSSTNSDKVQPEGTARQRAGLLFVNQHSGRDRPVSDRRRVHPQQMVQRECLSDG